MDSNAPDESVNGCNYMIIQQNMGIQYAFDEGENVIEFTPEKAGKHLHLLDGNDHRKDLCRKLRKKR